MGSSGSKAAISRDLESSSDRRRRRTRSRPRFQSACLGLPSGSRRHDCRNQQREEERKQETESDELKIDCDGKVKEEVPSDVDGCWRQSASIASTTGSSSARSSSTPSRFLSRFSFVPGNISFRLSRAASLGSSRANNLSVMNDEEEEEEELSLPSIHSHRGTDRVVSSVGRNVDSSNSGVVDGNVDSGIGGLSELENIGNRFSDRRIGMREPVERNVRFSRTLSVGRLRDRVLRRSSMSSDLTFCPMQQERDGREGSQGSGRHVFGNETRMPSSEANTSPRTSGYPSTALSSSLFNIQDPEVETSRSREARYHDLLEHRSNFLERRRRIRSQVRALQRLGSRFENLSGHERSCILSGQHRTGNCTCRVTNRDASSNDETGTRASISRIVMLAEALFEVLDEIHQQSVVLSSRPSVSALGSVPAPNDVVESLPVKSYNKSQKSQNEEAAQCYICLVEYEEDDSVRILPCHHEFHRTCIDKWLKEIHRVCPLCRGDICKSDPLPSES